MTLRVGVTGATGRMGRTIIETAAERDVEVAFAVNRDPAAGDVGGVDVAPAADFAALLEEREPDAVIDFTGPESSVSYVRDCAAAGVPIVIGTTGFSEAEHTAIEEAGAETSVLLGANFSRGIQALLDAVAAAVESLPAYDVEVTETHHNMKRDAPSGTAKVILDRIDAVRGESDRVHGREGEAPRTEGEIGVHARRAGDVTGEHEVLLADNHEVLELTHRAERRGVFAAGALDAAAWLVAQDDGFYRFSDISEELA